MSPISGCIVLPWADSILTRVQQRPAPRGDPQRELADAFCESDRSQCHKIFTCGQQLSSIIATDLFVHPRKLHPLCQQKPIVTYCREHAIVVQAYSPLIRASRMDHPVFVELAAKVRARVNAVPSYAGSFSAPSMAATRRNCCCGGPYRAGEAHSRQAVAGSKLDGGRFTGLCRYRSRRRLLEYRRTRSFTTSPLTPKIWRF